MQQGQFPAHFLCRGQRSEKEARLFRSWVVAQDAGSVISRFDGTAEELLFLKRVVRGKPTKLCPHCVALMGISGGRTVFICHVRR